MQWQNFDLFYETLGLDSEGAAKFAPGWSASQQTYPGGVPFFLREAFVDEIVKLSGLESEALALFRAGAAEAASEEIQCRFAWHCHWRLNLAGPEEGHFPYILRDTGKKGERWNYAAFTLATLAALPKVKKYYASRGIPLHFLQQSMRDLKVWTDTAFERAGKRQCMNQAWLHNHMQPNLFTLGRLQFQFGAWQEPVMVYQHKQSGELCFFAKGNLEVSKEGYLFANQGEKAAFLSSFRAEKHQVSGNRINALGRLEEEIFSISTRDWQAALEIGQPVLFMHIPAGAPLSKAACLESIKTAYDFFPRYFPEFAYKAIVSSSWLFDYSLSEYMPGSNIAAFQSLFHLFPKAGANDWQTRERVFANPELPLNQVPQASSLQKIVKQHMLAGGFWHSGGAFLLANEIKK
ncbi:MAG: acyltransferase domain-containing protein [Lentisphaeria bacterium]|nr:acyltransferase domain-containing protein [Lentisphaeria bacterium]